METMIEIDAGLCLQDHRHAAVALAGVPVDRQLCIGKPGPPRPRCLARKSPKTGRPGACAPSPTSWPCSAMLPYQPALSCLQYRPHARAIEGGAMHGQSRTGTPYGAMEKRSPANRRGQ
jgi:hypothetical protein